MQGNLFVGATKSMQGNPDVKKYLEIEPVQNGYPADISCRVT